MNHQLRGLYQEALDFVTYVKLYAPDFPARDEMTCQKAMSRLFEYLETIDEMEENPFAKQWLGICRETLKNVNKFFDGEQHSQGRVGLGSARDYLSNASRRKSIESEFIGGESGEAQDLNSGFPS